MQTTDANLTTVLKAIRRRFDKCRILIIIDDAALEDRLFASALCRLEPTGTSTWIVTAPNAPEHSWSGLRHMQLTCGSNVGNGEAMLASYAYNNPNELQLRPDVRV